MNREYKIATLEDILKLEDDQIERLAAELPAMMKMCKGTIKSIQNLASENGIDIPDCAKMVFPITWIDDGKQEITLTAVCEEKELFTIKVS